MFARIFLVCAFFSPILFAAEGVTENSVIVGIVNTTSGPTATTGIMFNAGPKVFFEKLNKAGGVNGRKIEAKYYDDGYEPVRAAAETKKAIENDHVFVILNNNGTPTAKAVMPIIDRANVPFLFPRTGDVAVRDPFNRNIFNLRSSFAVEMTALVNYVVDKEKKKKVSILTQADVFGKVVQSAAQKALRDKNIENFAAIGEVPRNSVDVTEAFETIAKSKPDVVVLGVTQAAAVPFVKLAFSKGKKWRYIALNNLNPIVSQLTGKEGDNILISQVVPNPETSQLPMAVQFRADMKAAEQEKSTNFVAFEGYINAYFFAEALKAAGKDPTRESLIEAFESKEFDLGGIKVLFSKTDHDATLPVLLTRIKGQKYIDIK